MKIGVIGRLTDHIQVAWIYFFVIYWLSFPLVTRYLLCFNFFTILSILFYPICHQVWSLLFFSIHSDFTQYSQAVEARIPVVSSECLFTSYSPCIQISHSTHKQWRRGFLSCHRNGFTWVWSVKVCFPHPRSHLRGMACSVSLSCAPPRFPRRIVTPFWPWSCTTTGSIRPTWTARVLILLLGNLPAESTYVNCTLGHGLNNPKILFWKL